MTDGAGEREREKQCCGSSGVMLDYLRLPSRLFLHHHVPPRMRVENPSMVQNPKFADALKDCYNLGLVMATARGCIFKIYW